MSESAMLSSAILAVVGLFLAGGVATYNENTGDRLNWLQKFLIALGIAFTLPGLFRLIVEAVFA